MTQPPVSPSRPASGGGGGRGRRWVRGRHAALATGVAGASSAVSTAS